MTVSTTLEERANLLLAAGRIRAYEKMPYLRAALWGLKFRLNRQVPTAATDARWRMSANPEFICTCNVDEVAAVLLHEVSHPLRGHAKRWQMLGQPTRFHPLYNAGADAAIDADLRDAGVNLPAGKWWYPERIPGGKKGMTAEQYFRLLMNTPLADQVAGETPELLVLPNALRYDYGTPQPILAAARRAIFTGTVTVTILSRSEGPVEGITGPVTVHDARTMSFNLVGTLPAGEYLVIAECGDNTATAALSITEPSIELRPDHLGRGYTAPAKIVVEGNDTRFTAGTTVELVDADKNVVAGAISNVFCISATTLTFDLGQVLDGMYYVKVTAGNEVSVAALPVGLPYLDLTPDQLPSGHGTPYHIAGISEDFTFDATSTIDVIDPQQFGAVIPGATSPLTVVAPNVVNFDVIQSLPDGVYLVVVTTGDERAVATLTVGGSGGGGSESQADSGGSGEQDADGQNDSSGGGQGEGDQEGGDGQDDSSGGGEGEGDQEGGDGGGDLLPDCGSSTGGGRRPWEDGDDQDNDGSVNEGRAEMIRRQVAQDIKDYAARGRGTVPAGLQRWADEILDPKVDWRDELRSKTNRVAANVAGRKDYSYSRPSRRSGLMPGIIQPAMVNHQPPVIAFVIDTSASVSNKMLALAVAEVKGALKHTRGRVVIIVVDAEAHEPQRINDISKIALKGGGGTDMRVGIEAVAKLRPRVDAYVVATDGDTPWPTEPPADNPNAMAIALLVDGDRSGDYEVPSWMHKIVINRDGEREQ